MEAGVSAESFDKYDHVLDHYETRERKIPEKVLDGYDVETEYKDLGNGYFDEIEKKVPRYRTEYRIERYEEPVYRDIPVYKKKYYYSIMRWLYDRDETVSGKNNEPYYPKLTLSDLEREGSRKEEYRIVSGKRKYKTSREIWDKIKPKSKIKARIDHDEIVELK